MSIDWRQVAGRMRAELDRAALNERPRLVVAVLIKATLMRERVRVVLPDREQLCALLGVAKQHMGGVWRELESCGIAKFRQMAGGWEVVVEPDSAAWSVDWVYTREELSRYLEFVERTPGQAQGDMLPPEPNLRATLAEVGAEKVSNQKCYSPVTKLVTEAAPLNVQRLKPCTDNAFNVERSKGGEGDLVRRCYQVLGEQNMEQYGGGWRVRARQNPGLLSRILDETENAVKERRVRTTAGRYANDLWGRWGNAPDQRPA